MLVVLSGAALVLAASYPDDTQVNLAPIAGFTRTPSSGGSPFEVTFNGAASTDPDGAIVQFRWDFGDGSSATGVTATHTYTATSTRSFTATLTVTDNGGRSATATATITVTVSDEASPAPCNCSGPDLDCSDFATHAAAWACYDYCKQQGYGDVFRLDGDSDGIACESLP